MNFDKDSSANMLSFTKNLLNLTMKWDWYAEYPGCQGFFFLKKDINVGLRSI